MASYNTIFSFDQKMLGSYGGYEKGKNKLVLQHHHPCTVYLTLLLDSFIAISFFKFYISNRIVYVPVSISAADQTF